MALLWAKLGPFVSSKECSTIFVNPFASFWTRVRSIWKGEVWQSTSLMRLFPLRWHLPLFVLYPPLLRPFLFFLQLFPESRSRLCFHWNVTKALDRFLAKRSQRNSIIVVQISSAHKECARPHPLSKLSLVKRAVMVWKTHIMKNFLICVVGYQPF